MYRVGVHMYLVGGPTHEVGLGSGLGLGVL